MKFRNHKYTYAKPFGSASHNWELIGPTGGINFHVSIVEKYGVTAGLEFHYSKPPEYMSDDPPSFTDCPLIGGRCWHDGTSLYATKSLWPIVEPLLRGGDHDAIFRLLEGEYRTKLAPRTEGGAS